MNTIAAGPSHGSMRHEWNRKNARRSGDISVSFSQASGIIIKRECGSDLPSV